MKVLTFKTGSARDKYACDNYLFARIEFTNAEMAVSVGPDCREDDKVSSRLWSHTVFELENLAIGLRFVALGGLPQHYEVPSRESLIGPSVGLCPALEFQLGHPGIGVDGWGTMIYCSMRRNRPADRSLVEVAALNERRSARATFEVDEVLGFAEELYDQAKRIAAKYVRDATGPQDAD